MSRNSMSLKARIRNLARDKGVPVQTVFRNFIFERFLDRLSKSNYQDKFILKDRILITSLVGIDNRATMDLDITLINFPLNSCSISETIKNIFSQNIDDGFVFFL